MAVSPENTVEVVAKAMEERRKELIARPLAFIWKELAEVAIESLRKCDCHDME